MPVKGHVSDFQQWLDESRDATPTTTRCAECPWSHVGPAGEGREAAREHRRVEHPDRPLVAVRPKPKPKPKPVREPRRTKAAAATRPPAARPRGRPAGSQKLTPARIDAARRVYLEGWTVAMIGELVAPIWEFASSNSATVCVLAALHRAETPMRPRGKRAMLPEIGRREAEELIRSAG